MNIPKTIESATVDALRSYGVGAETLIRSWRNLQKDEKWDEDNDRSFPCIDVKASPPRLDQANAVTLMCEVALTIYTKLADDQSHSVLNSIEQATQECIDTLYAQHRSNATTGLYADLVASIESECAVSIGGLYIGDPTPPDEDGEGRTYVGLTLVIAYSRADF
jgi:hypothetical protein